MLHDESHELARYRRPSLVPPPIPRPKRHAQIAPRPWFVVFNLSQILALLFAPPPGVRVSSFCPVLDESSLFPLADVAILVRFIREPGKREKRNAPKTLCPAGTRLDNVSGGNVIAPCAGDKRKCCFPIALTIRSGEPHPGWCLACHNTVPEACRITGHRRWEPSLGRL
ncbi:hypothetical protein GQ53DRAFT_17013 [Thozetella sp. PMI_491]|nr:hypothetical protein GQ53DRAFT_17013 [Thozetella sp. PMI_491]